MPDPTADSIAQVVVAESGIVQGFNRILAARDIVLFPQETAVGMLADYAVESGTFYRGVKHVLGTLVEELLFDEAKGTVMLDAALVRRSIDRASGIAPPDSNDQSEGGLKGLADSDLDAQPEAVLTEG
jgi:ATP-dependent protease Clp ATPase subunit